jgi:shikimate kinase|tara:strand:+ start:15735 stop:16244 length:510 start_codon:yes stop_codon:yes gene_type:complete
MGVGKSAVGRNVARILKYPFIDSDTAIEAAEGRRIRKIFETDGEDCFREQERKFLVEGHPTSGQVVACGGGLPIPEGRGELLSGLGVVVCLFASVETILRRTSTNNRRPLLDGEDPEGRIRKLLAVREPVYMSCGIGVSAEGRTLDEVTGNVVRVYRRAAADYGASTDA